VSLAKTGNRLEKPNTLHWAMPKMAGKCSELAVVIIATAAKRKEVWGDESARLRLRFLNFSPLYANLAARCRHLLRTFFQIQN
jgi:hypothetical protein